MKELTAHIDGEFPAGQRLVLADGEVSATQWPMLAGRNIPALRVGDVLTRGGEPFARVESASWWTGNPSRRVWVLEALARLEPGEVALAHERRGRTLAWITLSDKGAAGLRADASGPLIEEMVRAVLPLGLARGFVLPDDERALRALIADLALVQGYDLVLTTGGTGVAPRDVTPEATLAVIEKRLPGFERAMTAASLTKTPFGAVSRAVAGTLGQSLVLNLPGSPKAVRECLEPLLPALAHTLDKLQGDPAECGGLA
ncbi:molybdenum cofactor synthesis domain-containing protein [Desulfovibrio aminophilus]|uniref:MogA/MoaB family molybdenum cofactor biosynthesis protein n=1 Tax=Desulfovibrio aminophilus TaxID=81425 RepID=UPI00339288F2